MSQPHTIDTVMFAASLPVNPTPFAQGLKDYILNEGGSATDDKAKRIVYTLLCTLGYEMSGFDLAVFEQTAQSKDHILGGNGFAVSEVNRLLTTTDTAGRSETWKSMIQGIVCACWGTEGRLSMIDEWERLRNAYTADQHA